MDHPPTIGDGQYGQRATLHSEWSDHFVDLFAKHAVVELELNIAKGWRGHHVGFLTKVPGLKGFEILAPGLSDVEPIHHLHGLKRLSVTTYCSTPIDCSAFPELEDLSLEWRPKATSLFESVGLKKLFISRYKGKESGPFGQLVNLQSLGILDSPMADLHGFRSLTKLRSLRLGLLRRLTSLHGIEVLANLEELDINTCRSVGTIRAITGLVNLRRLHVNNCGDIDSLGPVAGLDKLELVVFYESTNILDGDLTPLLGLKRLAHVSFQNRRHYSHRRESLSQYRAGQPSTPHH